MADSSHSASPGEADRESPPGMPRWVKIAAIIVGILVLLFVVLKLTGIGGEHGPGRHLSAGNASVVSSAAVPGPVASMFG